MERAGQYRGDVKANLYKNYSKEDLNNLLSSEKLVVDVNSGAAAMTIRNVLSIIGYAFGSRDHVATLEDTLTQVLDMINEHRMMLERSKDRVKRLKFLLGKK